MRPAARAATRAAGMLTGTMGLLALAGLAGCVTESAGTVDGLPRPARAEPLAEPPSGLEPTDMVLLVGQGTRDGDGDGYPDTFSVTAALRSADSSVMIDAAGSFIFELWREGTVAEPGATPLARWVFEPEAVAAARTRTLYGWGYQFVLGLTEAGVDDRFGRFSGDIRGRFVSLGGTEVRCSDDVRPVRLGR
ncbi:MAG: hypothetical protein ACYTEV_01460 [Planctomycetota bacterium]